ncbi:unnamed protein product [Soboliphyme baturini]|uniref:Uncharacterized protein n=1 Tax=Soboliphyme baturini TaxID=241478 RepID=A0A183IRL9_9BILA|nr:unnamed protein product [Soboliphyme baturini]
MVNESHRLEMTGVGNCLRRGEAIGSVGTSSDSQPPSIAFRLVAACRLAIVGVVFILPDVDDRLYPGVTKANCADNRLRNDHREAPSPSPSALMKKFGRGLTMRWSSAEAEDGATRHRRPAVRLRLPSLIGNLASSEPTPLTNLSHGAPKSQRPAPSRRT